MATTAPVKENPFVSFLQRYRGNPVAFVRQVLGEAPDVWQAEMLAAVAGGERKISIRSGHGVGKSTAAAWVMLHYVLTRYPCKVVVTAPTSSQLYDALMAELKRWIKALPAPLRELLEVKSDRVELRASATEAFISARTSRSEQPEALQGVHSEHVLLIADEASGVAEQVFEAAAGSMSGHSATTILLGNPIRNSGFFYETHHRLRAEWWTRRVSCIDSPRVSDAYVAEMAARYGEDSNAYRTRCLGEWPRADDDTIISMELLESALHRDVAPVESEPTVWGLDVSRFGGDRTALCKRKGNTLLEPVRVFDAMDLMQLTGRIVAEYDGLDFEDRPEEILVDSIGLGAGVVDRLSEIGKKNGLNARGINVSESPALGQTYRNLRAELWYKARAWLEARDCKLANDEHLVAELATVRYKYTSSGKIQVESKDEMKRRGLRSPDLADAFVLTFASTAASALHGASTAWSQSLKRNIPRIRASLK